MLKYILAIICNVFLCANLAVCSVPTGYGEFSVTYTNGSETLVYVATNGSDTTGDGSLGNPWGTLVKALSMVSANTVIYVRGGSYPYCQKLGMSGWSNWVTVKNYPGETASFDGIDFSFNYLSYPSNFRIDGIRHIEVLNEKFEPHNMTIEEYYEKYILPEDLPLT